MPGSGYEHILIAHAHAHAHAFASVEYVQMGIVALLAAGAAALPRFTKAAANAPVVDA